MTQEFNMFTCMAKLQIEALYLVIVTNNKLEHLVVNQNINPLYLHYLNIE